MSTRVRRSELFLLVFLGVVFAVSSTLVVGSVAHLDKIGLTVHGVENGAVLRGAAFREVSVSTGEPDLLDRVEVLVDDTVIPTSRDRDRLTLGGFTPAEGEHTLIARVRSATPLVMDAVVDHRFTIDDTPPSLAVQHVRAAGPRSPVTVRGVARGAALVRVGQTRALVVNGVFAATVPAAATVFVEARDAAGNSYGRHVPVPVSRPDVRAEWVTATDWAAAPSRERVLARARGGEIDAVRLDVKDETGQVAYLSEVSLAHQIGAVRDLYDPRAAVEELHRAGVRAVARVVAFQDPVLARASAASGLRDHVGDAAGLTLTNPAHPEVRGYVVALAREAASLGFDDVVLDHAGVESDVDFVAEVRDAVRAGGACFGVVAADGKAVQADFVVPSGR
ncbi:putative glycoside hydrolase [Lentzea sp. HUAS12]|uniref:putative glycoside hydrolase n=1 Tax=Lentzea sp. HUAS12 TaxID=2951806 RepID=UPI00209DF640|nr:putative glycoside hydrolase [Lentzea sp. HUAS12]USX54708.1 putative glycoside hydrolase [Lentzea sp. HUAS12]